MTPRGHAPGPTLLLGAAASALAFSVDDPVILAAVAVGALALHLAAPRRSRFLLVVGAMIGVTALVLNPFVQANGDLILLDGPDIPIFDLQVTMEEVVAGAALALRAFAVTLVVSAALAHADPDRLLGVAARLLPRSALAASIAARMVPLVERDSRSLWETARLRGRSLTYGPARARARGAAALAMPLVGSALERSLDVAEAMAARGYGSGRRTRMPEAPWTPAERVVFALALVMTALAGLALAGVIGRFGFYPTLEPHAAVRDLLVAGSAAAVLVTGSVALRR